jgi:uncharacterized membrane protein
MAAGAPGAFGKDLYDVAGVARDDVLNLRRNVAGAADLRETEIVGRIPWDARDVVSSGRIVRFGGDLWREVGYGGAVGWVNGRYLAPAAGFDADARPDALSCGGTEPFWSLRLGSDEAVFETPGVEAPEREEYRVLATAAGRNRARQWAYYLGPGSPATRIALVTRTEACSDGMSDFTYPYELVLVDVDPGDGPLQGCCSLPLP